ncbi:hypothetical protein ACJX0J_005826 [Zea mays]
MTIIIHTPSLVILDTFQLYLFSKITRKYQSVKHGRDRKPYSEGVCIIVQVIHMFHLTFNVSVSMTMLILLDNFIVCYCKEHEYVLCAYAPLCAVDVHKLCHVLRLPVPVNPTCLNNMLYMF